MTDFAQTTDPQRKTASSTSVYPSAVDTWILVLLTVGPVMLAVLSAWLLVQGEQQDSLICLGAGVFNVVMIALFTTPCRYTILADSVTIRCGVIFMRVPIDKIKSVEKSGSLLSAPALSIRRVKISTPSKIYLVSPKDRDGFIEELQSRLHETAE